MSWEPEKVGSETFHRALGETEEFADTLIRHLSLVRHILDAVTPVRTFAAAAQAIAKALVVELGFERAAVIVTGDDGEREVLGQHSQAERFGGEARLPEAERRAMNALAGRVIAQGGVLHWRAGEDTEALGRLGIDGTLVGVPLVVGGERCGAVVAQRLVGTDWAVAQRKAFELVSQIIGQVVTVTQLRISLMEVREEIEAEFGRTRSKLVAQEQTLKSQAASIARLTEALIASSRLKSDFLGVISHQLRTPLNVILGYGALLRDGSSGPLSADQADQLDRIICNGRNLSQLVDDIMFFEQTESTRVAPRPERFELRPLIEEICAALPEITDPHSPELRVEIDSRAESLFTDRSLLKRVLFHLVSNAYKFTRAGSVRVEVRPGADANAVRFVVADTGAGIPRDRLHVLFSLFHDGDRPAKRRLGGVGLGLALVRRCLRILGGSLSMDSREGEGTEVLVTIPNALVDMGRQTRADR